MDINLRLMCILLRLWLFSNERLVRIRPKLRRERNMARDLLLQLLRRTMGLGLLLGFRNRQGPGLPLN